MPDAGHPRGKRHEQRGDGRSDMVIWTATPPVFTTRPASRGRSRTRRPERRRNRRLAPGVVRHRRAELLPPALAKVRAALPHLEISLRVADRDQALSTLRQGTLDLAVIEVHPARGDGPRPDLRPLLSDPFRIVVPRGHRLAKSTSSSSPTPPTNPGLTSDAKSAAAAPQPAAPSAKPDLTPAG